MCGQCDREREANGWRDEDIWRLQGACCPNNRWPVAPSPARQQEVKIVETLAAIAKIEWEIEQAKMELEWLEEERGYSTPLGDSEEVPD